MSDHWDDLDRNSIRAAEAKFGVRHPRHEDESATSDQCPVFTFGFRCLRDAGHSGEHGVNPEPSPERAILTDLIAELRDIQSATYEQRSSVELVARREETLDALDRAGARLREVGDE